MATGPGVETLADDLLTAHMVQHLLLADVAALLLAVGLTGPVLRPLLSSPALRWLTPLANPVVAVSLFTANLYLWHVPALYQAGRGLSLAHVAEHALFIATGILLWLGLFGPLPKPAWFGNLARVGYAACIWLPAIALANVFMWSGQAFYPAYEAAERARGVEPLADQSTSGAVLMIWCSVLAAGIFAGLILRWAQSDTERQELLDLAEREGITLDDARARRAAEADRPPTFAEGWRHERAGERNHTGNRGGQLADVEPQAAKEATEAQRLAAEAQGRSAARRRRLVQYGSASIFLAICALVVLVIVSQAGGGSGGDTHIDDVGLVQNQLQGIPQADTVLGDPRAKATVVEFGDLQCPVCRAFSYEIAPRRSRGRCAEGTLITSSGSFRSWAPIRSTPRRRRWPPATRAATGTSSSSSTATRASRTPAMSPTPSSRRWPGRRGSPSAPCRRLIRLESSIQYVS